MTVYYVECGDIRETVEADDHREAAVKALHQFNERTAGQNLRFRLSLIVSVSPTGFDADDAAYAGIKWICEEAGVVLDEASYEAIVKTAKAKLLKATAGNGRGDPAQ